MSPIKTLLAATAAVSFAIPAFAESHIMIQDAYARAAGMNAMAGAAFMQIMNHGDEDDRMIAAKATVSKRVELHTHIENDEGVMRMVEVEEGFPVAAGETHMLQRGGDHVMFMGLTEPFTDGKVISVTLVFEKAGEITVDIPVDLNRKPANGMAMQMGDGEGMQHGDGEGMQHGQATTGADNN
ncbi:copper chaperone PCu(A)C [Aliiroseovarius subalbicans]|uniref:copper chaperone PCu(A)C n=1 Tax=Aliiroseovarius subalbicans TaxID=2925840 RepID=UPI001F597044|nr:copper chaperone PCu(A)C [Aliiroseovarius subalbicans]MCI2400393.1 copper chaperone PCu(A)C [Aliiroseovarius subalbicans]